MSKKQISIYKTVIQRPVYCLNICSKKSYSMESKMQSVPNTADRLSFHKLRSLAVGPTDGQFLGREMTQFAVAES